MTALSISAIRRDGGTQPRDHISLDIAKDYAEAIVDGAVLPPVIVFYDGSEYWLADGFHRVEAHQLLELTEIEADVRQGDRRQAVLHSVGANADHGYRRSNMDKRRAVVTLLNDPEWVTWSDNEIARRCHVGHQLVGKLRPPITCPATSEPVRTFIDKHGNATHMKVGAIGKAKPSLPVVAGRQTERKPDPTVERGEEAGINMAARITGLSARNLSDMARSGEIDGARKEGGSWVFPTAPLKAMVEEGLAPPAIPAEPEPIPAPRYDFDSGARLLACNDMFEQIRALPPAGEMLRMWALDVGAGPTVAEIVEVAGWMATFAAGWPAVEAERKVRKEAMFERIEADVVK